MYSNPDQAHPHPAAWSRIPMPLNQASPTTSTSPSPSSPKSQLEKSASWLYAFLFAGNATSPPLYQYVLVSVLTSFIATRYFPTFASSYIRTPIFPAVLIGTYTLLWNLGVVHRLWKGVWFGRPPLWQLFVFAGGVTWVGIKYVPGYKEWVGEGNWRNEVVGAVLGLGYSGCWKVVVFLRDVKREVDEREEGVREKDDKMEEKNDLRRPCD